MVRIAVITPHPDDDYLGSGGAMARHLKNGNEVFVVYVTTGAVECTNFPLDKFIEIRKKETLNAARVFGLKEKNLFFLNEKPWEINEASVRLKLISLIRKIKPDVCYIPHKDDAHVDHKIVSRAAFDAINMAPSPWFIAPGSEEKPCSTISTVLAYEVWTPLIAPNYLEDITNFLELKRKALKEHKTQDPENYVKANGGLNAFRGAMCEGRGVEVAEAFQILNIQNIFGKNEVI